MYFWQWFLDFGYLLDAMFRTVFHYFGVICSSIVFASICYRVGEGCWSHVWSVFWYLFRSRMQPAKPSEIYVVLVNLNDFTIQKNMVFNNFHDIVRYLFWHWFRMCFGIDCVTLKAPFRHQCSWFWLLVFLMICWWHCSRIVLRFCDQNRVPEFRPWIPGLAAAPQKSRFGAAIVPRTFFHRFGTVVGSIWWWFRRLFRQVFGGILQ